MKVQPTAFALIACCACQDRGAPPEPPVVTEVVPPEPAVNEAPASDDEEAPNDGTTVRFEGPVEALPAGWTAHAGAWQVVEETSARSGPGVLQQSARSGRNVFNVVLASGLSHRDVELSVEVRAVRGDVDRGGGPIWRAKDARNYYIARYNPLEDNLRVYLVEKGRRKMLGTETVRVDHRTWHLLGVRMVGDRIEVDLDGEKHLDVRDATFPEAGAVGLWTKADAHTQFDDLTVRDLDR